MARLISLLLLLFISSLTYAQYSNRYYGMPEICFEFYNTDVRPGPAPAPVPKPEPSPYKCPKCKDTKWIIHGDGHKSPCPDCNTGKQLASTNVSLSQDFQYVIINNIAYKRKAPMAGNGIWVGVDKWKVCYGQRGCRIYTITDQTKLGLNLGDYNVY